jgi:hypothetical protein
MHNVYVEIVLIVNVVIQLNFVCKHDQKWVLCIAGFVILFVSVIYTIKLGW